MASHLTISIELIAFMKWVLQRKQAALNTFLKQVMDSELRAELEEIINHPKEVSSDELYQIVNTFFGHVEERMISQLEDKSLSEEDENSVLLYKSLSPQMQAQLTQAFDDDVLYHGVHQAADALSAEQDARPENKEQVKKHILMRSLLNNWSPSDEEMH